MEIFNLTDHPKFILPITGWLYSEFIQDLRRGISLEDVTKALHNRQKDKLPMTYIGVINAECIGTISLVANDLRERSDLTPWLAALYIRDDHRRQGYAQELIYKVIETAAGMMYRKLYLRTETAAGYYQKLGWQKIYETTDQFGLFTEVLEVDLPRLQV